MPWCKSGRHTCNFVLSLKRVNDYRHLRFKCCSCQTVAKGALIIENIMKKIGEGGIYMKDKIKFIIIEGKY